MQLALRTAASGNRKHTVQFSPIVASIKQDIAPAHKPRISSHDGTENGQDSVLHDVATTQKGPIELRNDRVAILIEDNDKTLGGWYVMVYFREPMAEVKVIGPNSSSQHPTMLALINKAVRQHRLVATLG